MYILLLSFLISLGINLALFIPAFIYKTDKLTDLSYSLTFITVALGAYALSSKTTAHLLILVLVLLWAFRLGSFLVMRIQHMKTDKRFDGMREDFFKFLQFWVLQAVSVFVILLPALLVFGQSVTKITILSWAGVAILLFGLAVEATADQQKFRFSKSAQKGNWIDVGLWRVSRHPNYLGEILMWVGMYLVCFGSLGHGARLVGLLSPLFIATLLLFVSGMPILERAADKRWGKEKTYQNYKKAVPRLVPSARSIRRLWS
jgi:steroid 5-alpha reductase family enzyme